MMDLINSIEEIWDESTSLVEKRWNSFLDLGKNGSEEELFSELSFCVLTANWSAKGGIKAQKEIGNGFCTFTREELEDALRKVGHRFPSARSNYIVQNRWIIGKLKRVISMPSEKAREYIIENVKGIGWKESSHFLRNVGVGNVAILDKHIMRMMVSAKIIDEIPKRWTKSRYLDYESRLIPVAKHFKVSFGKLDLYMWYAVKKSVDK